MMIVLILFYGNLINQVETIRIGEYVVNSIDAEYYIENPQDFVGKVVIL